MKQIRIGTLGFLNHWAQTSHLLARTLELELEEKIPHTRLIECRKGDSL